MTFADCLVTAVAHPEYAWDFMKGLVATRGKGVVPEETLTRTRARLSDPLDSHPIAERIAAFFKAKHS